MSLSIHWDDQQGVCFFAAQQPTFDHSPSAGHLGQRRPGNNKSQGCSVVQISISSSACLHSQVLHVSGTAVLQAGLKDSKVEVLDNCGHAIALELPRRAADIIVDFLSAQEVKRKNAKKDPWWKYLKTFGLLISCNYGIETSMMELESYEMKENVKCILTKLTSIILFTCKQKVCLMFTVQFSDARNTPTDQQEEEIFFIMF